MANIRYATIDDVMGIARVIWEAFGERPDTLHCMEVLDRAKQIVWVAEEEDRIEGFVAGFLTVVQKAVRRWEIDLLAVRPDSRGKSLSVQLLEAAWQDAKNHQVNFARGLVRVENHAAQESFKRAGYATNGKIYDLVIWEPQPSTTTCPERSQISLIPVDTLTYRGVWIEGVSMPHVSTDELAQCIEAARALAAAENRQYASAIVPVEQTPHLLGAGTVQGRYLWWRKP